MIEVKNLSKTYGERKAISDLSFEVSKGEVVGFLGPNGAGKTTTMKIITGFMAPTSGQVTVAGHDVFENPIAVKRKLGYLPETPPVYGDMVVEKYLSFVAELKGVEKAKIGKAVGEALEKTNLVEVRSRLIQNLSKGYRQRVGLAQALVNSPEVLILDEPTVGLDPRQVAEIRSLLQNLRGHHTIVLSTHILSEVEATCSRVIIINKGEIIAKDSIQSLKSKLHGSRIIRLRVRRKQTELSAKLQEFAGVESVNLQQDSLHIVTDGSEDVLERLAEAAVSSGAGLVELSQPSAGLEDVFIQLTGQQALKS